MKYFSKAYCCKRYFLLFFFCVFYSSFNYAQEEEEEERLPFDAVIQSEMGGKRMKFYGNTRFNFNDVCSLFWGGIYV